MAEYVYISKEGKETGRKPKGRGRTEKGAVQRDDGNWYIVEKAYSLAPSKPQKAKVVKSIEGSSNELTGARNDLQENLRGEIKDSENIFQATTPVPYNTFKKEVHVPPPGTHENDDYIVLLHVAVFNLENLNLPRLVEFGIYGKMVIDKKTGTLYAWNTVTHKNAIFKIENAISFNKE